MPLSLCFITRPSCKHALRMGEMQYFLLVGDRDTGGGRGSLIMQRSYKKDASFSLCERPLERMSSEGQHAKGSMPIYLIKAD